MKKQKAFISVDMEGLPHITSNQHMSPGQHLYDEARSIMTECVLAMVEELHAQGFERVLVADGHGPKVNLIPDRMPEFVEVVRGNPRSISMVAGGKGCDAALFLGYHARPGTPNSTFDHTIDDRIIRTVKYNGVESSEYYMNAATLGEQGVPLIMVAGDKTLLDDDVAKNSPWAVRVPLKESLGRYAAQSPSMGESKDRIRNGVRDAVREFDRGSMVQLKLNTPVDVEIYFTNSEYAHIASHLPGSKLIGGWGVHFIGKTMEEAYRVTQLLVFAASGVRAGVGE
jgi:D-amino peptidase